MSSSWVAATCGRIADVSWTRPVGVQSSWVVATEMEHGSATRRPVSIPLGSLVDGAQGTADQHLDLRVLALGAGIKGARAFVLLRGLQPGISVAAGMWYTVLVRL